MSWHLRQVKKRDEEEDDEDEEEEERRKGFLGFPISQSSPTPTSPPVRCPPPPPEPARPPPPANGERRPRGRPPKNWPWGKVKDGARGVGRPPKIRPVEDDDDEDERPEAGKGPGSASCPPSLFSLDRQGESAAIHSLDMARHPSITPARRGRPPRKKRGPKPRLTEGPGEGLAPLPVVSRLSSIHQAPAIRNNCFSESSEEEEEEEDDDDDEDDEERSACSPPILTKPAMGLKCKVRRVWRKWNSLEMVSVCHYMITAATDSLFIAVLYGYSSNPTAQHPTYISLGL